MNSEFHFKIVEILKLRHKQLLKRRMREASRRHYDKNKEAILAKEKIRKASNPEKLKAERKLYRERNIEKISAWHRDNFIKNKENLLKKSREWYIKNKQRKLDGGKIWRTKNRARFKAAQKAWVRNNPEKMRAKSKRRWDKNRVELNRRAAIRSRRRYKSDPIMKIKMAMYRALNDTMARKYVTGHCHEIIGCSYPELKAHLEKQFKPGMTWGNYGFFGWHIDHRKPLSSFCLTDPEQIKLCMSWKNLQPLWMRENLSKGDKILPEFSSLQTAQMEPNVESNANVL